jgi:hypothetical protein
VGLLDALTPGEVAEDPGDDLPVSLQDVIARYGQRYFKIKIGGDPARDRQRLVDVAAVLDASIAERYHVTLDANEQYDNLQAATELLQAIGAERSLARFFEAVRLVEQPLPRHRALDGSVDALGRIRPVIIDESDDALDAFSRARALGDSGVSSKQCKGLWKSLVNAARCLRRNQSRSVPRYLLTAEDLSCQGGVSVQQDLALSALLGIPHCERNGHFYGGPMPGATRDEHHAFLAAHPDLYEDVHRTAALRIHRGTLDLRSLHTPGFAHGADPVFDTMDPLGAA